MINELSVPLFFDLIYLPSYLSAPRSRIIFFLLA